MRKLIDLTGQKFGKWTVLERSSNDRNGNLRWLCRCDCGREKIVCGKSLRSGNSKGCRSCFVKNILTKHGQWRTRLYRVWQGMIQRCEYPNHKGYKYYGGRGIRVCPEWREDFAAFKKWALEHGYRDIPNISHGKRLSIDRIDSDGDYAPKNCQFLTRSENSSKSCKERGESLGNDYERTRDNGPNRYPG